MTLLELFKVSPPVSFPWRDLFCSHIIPDILSEHIHQVLVEGVIPEWNPFYILPLVSQDFHGMCKTMCANIFGLERDEGTEKIHSMFCMARKFWDQARLSSVAEEFHPIIDPYAGMPYTMPQLMQRKGLVQVYLCTAIAHSFFKFDVLRSLELDGRAIPETDSDVMDADSDLMDTDSEDSVDTYSDSADVDQDPLDLDLSDIPRGNRMPDEFMHRVYLPLLCAVQVCDSIRPERLGYIIAKYLADIVPRYSTEPVFLKCTQDLELYIRQRHRVDMDTWSEWTSRALGLLEDAPDLLICMQRQGKLVESFKRGSSIPWQVIEETEVVTAVYDVTLADWGRDTEIIRARARDLLMEFPAK